MAMVGVDFGSLHRWTYSLSHLAYSWVGGHLAPFYIHQMNWVNSHNGSAMMTKFEFLPFSKSVSSAIYNEIRHIATGR